MRQSVHPEVPKSDPPPIAVIVRDSPNLSTITNMTQSPRITFPEGDSTPGDGKYTNTTITSSDVSANSGVLQQRRKLTFADENGGELAEISYSNRTHYSKQSSTSSLPGVGRGCCVIS